MTDTGEQPDYDDWDDGDGPDGPGFDERLTELAVELAELVGLTVGPPVAPEPSAQYVIVKLTCGRCDAPAFLAHLRLDPGVTHEVYDTHLCTGLNNGHRIGEPVVFPFTLALRSGT